MKILINVSNNLFTKIKNLVESDKYSSVSDFFLAAGENQLLLEDTHSEGPIEMNMEDAAVEVSSKLMTSKKDLFIPRRELITSVEMPKDKQLKYEKTTSLVDMYLWGQINRIFPLKISLRVLSNFIVEKNTQYVDLEEYAKKTVKVAHIVRKQLVEKTQHITGKKDSLWAGLPDGRPKSIARYRCHFLAYLRKDDIIEGGLGRLKFVNLTRNDNKVFIGITKHGLDFSVLTNPILDKNIYNSGSLSEEEKQYYLSYISTNVSYEKQAFIDVLELINKGITHLSSLNNELGKIWKAYKSEAIVNTQRNGIISRLVELGLVGKVKKGIEVEYKITDEGSRFIKNSAK